MRFKVYALAAPDGRILEIHRVTSALPGPEFLPSLALHLREMSDRSGRATEDLAADLRALRWERVRDPALALQLVDRPGAFYLAPDGRVFEKPLARLSIDTDEFVADGTDRAQVMVVGPLPASLWPIRLRINDRELAVEDGQVVEIVSKEPGVWRVAIVDERVYADPDSRLVRGVLPA